MRSSRRVKFEDGAAAAAAGCAFSAENIRTDDGGLESPDDGCPAAGMKKPAATGSRRDYEEEAAAPSFPEVTPTRSPDGGWGMRKNDGRRLRRRRDDSRDVSSRTPCESRPSRRHQLPFRPSRRRSSSLCGNVATTRSAFIAATSLTKTTYLPLFLILLFTFAAASTLAQVMDGTGTGGYPTQAAGEAASLSSTEDESETTLTTTTTATTTTTTEKGLLASTKLRSFGGRLWSFKTSDGGKTLSAVVDAIRSSTDHDRSLLSSLARRRTLLFPTSKLISARSDDEKVTWIKPASKEGRSRLSSKFSATEDPSAEREASAGIDQQAQGPPPPSSEDRPPALLVDPGNGSNSTAESADPPVTEAEPAISWNTTTDGEAGHQQPGNNNKGTKAKTGKRLRESPIYYIKMNPLLPPPPPPPPAPSSPLFMLPDFSSWANQNPAAAPVFHQQNHHQHHFPHQQQQQQQQQEAGIFAGLSRSSAGLLNYLPLNFRANGKPSLALTSRQQLQPPFWQTVLQQQQQQLSGSNGFHDHYQAQQQSGDLWAQQQHHNKQRLMQVGYQQHQGHPNHHHHHHPHYHQGQQSLDSNVIHLPLDFRINGKPHSVFHYPARLDDAAAPHKTSLLFSGLSQQQQTSQGSVLAGKKPKISFGNNPTTTSTTTTTTEAPDNAGIGSLFPDALGRNSPVHNLRNRYYFNGKPTGVFVFNTLKRYPYLYRNLQDLLVQSPLL